MSITFAAYRFDIPLHTPYVLSFGTVKSFATLYVVLEGEGRTGVGEITPLPGYSHETIETAEGDMERLCADLDGGGGFAELVRGLAERSPFAASGAACALETWKEGEETAFGTPSGEVPLSAFCGGATPEEAVALARPLMEKGHGVLKMKVGAMTPAEDAARIAAVSGILAPGAQVRLDANQAYSFDQALEMCRRLEDIPGVELLEQPFKPDDWDAHARLAALTSVPVMLDESIWDEGHVRRAAECGAAYVKFKLCKHPGMAASARLIALARELGLGVVYGNGVQSFVGNHLEARVHGAAGLATASEGNGFLKVASPPSGSRLEVSGGVLRSGGIDDIGGFAKHGRKVAGAKLSPGRVADL